MSAFTEQRFPDDISFNAVGGPEFSTDIVENYAGYEQRNVNWSQPRGAWNVAHGVKTQAQYALLIQFFYAMQGRRTGFRYKDWSDYTVTGGNIGTGDNSETEFQLRKQYVQGALTYNRTITKPVANTYTIYVDDVEQTETTHYTIDPTTGLVTFVTAPGSGLEVTADFEFDVPVRFNTDKLDLTLSAYEVASWQNIELVELRI